MRMAVRARQRAAAGAAVRVPAWAAVGGVAVAAALLYYLLGRQIVAPWILTDELIYSEMAKSFASTGHLYVRNVPFQTTPPLYPAVISPAYALFDHVPDAYVAAKVINALVMPLTAIPLYLLSRRVLSPAFAVAAAALGLVVPSVLYSGTLMTENLFFPAFAVVALLLVLGLERPTVARSIALIAASAVAFFVRAEALAFLPAIVLAPLLLVLFRGSGIRSLRAYLPLYAATAIAVVVPAIVQLARGRPMTSLFGRYSFVGTQHYSVSDVLRWLLYHVAEIDLYVGVIPFAALLVLVLLARELPERTQTFLAAAIALAACFVAVAAAYASALTFVHRVHERYMFYVAPLLLIALFVWIELGLPRPRRRAIAAAAVAALLPAVLPLGWMLTVRVVSDTLALIPWWRLDVALDSAAWTRVILVGACVAAGLLVLLVPRRFRLLLPALVGAYLLVVLSFTERQWQESSRAARATLGNTQSDWIDRRVPGDAAVALLYTGHVTPIVLWETEFFNRAAGPVYYLNERDPGDLPTARADVADNGRLVGVAPTRYGLSDAVATFAGPQLGSGGALTLYRLKPPPHLHTLVDGLYPGETWSGPRLRYNRFDCAGGRLAVTLGSNPRLFISPKTVTVTARERLVRRASVPPDRPVQLTLPLRPSAGTCRLDFAVRPAPLLTIPAGTPPRPLGATFTFG